VTPWIIGAVLLVAGAAVPFWTVGARKRDVEGSEARARAVYERLGFCVETVHPGDDPYVVRLLADAAERWHTTGAVLARAATAGEYEVATRTAREGLGYVADACDRLGLPVPEL
jgi:hypothetical protein